MGKPRAQSKSAAMKAMEQQLLKQLAEQTGQKYEDLAAKAEAERYPHRTKSMQMEATLDFIKHPGGWITRKCEECGEHFGTNYKHVAYCGDYCRAKAWMTRMKIPWNLAGKSQEEKWGGEIPVIIHPTVWRNLNTMLERMKELRDQNLAQQELDEVLQDIPEETLPDHLPQPDDYEEDSPPIAQTSRPVSQPQSTPYELPEVPSFSLS